MRGKRGRKVAVLLSPDMVDALTQLVSRTKESQTITPFYLRGPTV